MSKDKNNELEFLTSSTEKNTITINEIEFDGNAYTLASNDSITVDTPLSIHGTDVITVSQEDIAKITQGSNGIAQLDLFPDTINTSVTVTVNNDIENATHLITDEE